MRAKAEYGDTMNFVSSSRLRRPQVQPVATTLMGDQAYSSTGVAKIIPQFSVNNFDLLRILAATQVLYFHSLAYLKVPTPTWAIPFENLPGVPIFFVISGYLVSASYERSGDLITYFRNRALRIYPGLWCCLLITLITVSVFKY